MRYPTERNRMTVPANVPKYRHLPDTQEYLKGCSSTKLIKEDDKALRRNTDAIVFQTSGDYGQHYLGIETKTLRLQRKGISPAQTMMTRTMEQRQRKVEFEPQTTQQSARSDISGSLLTDRSSIQSFREEFNNKNINSETYTKTLNNLDKAFDRRAKKDLVAATLPKKSTQELVWCGTSNEHNALQSKPWADYLRKDAN